MANVSVICMLKLSQKLEIHSKMYFRQLVGVKTLRNSFCTSRTCKPDKDTSKQNNVKPRSRKLKHRDATEIADKYYENYWQMFNSMSINTNCDSQDEAKEYHDKYFQLFNTKGIANKFKNSEALTHVDAHGEVNMVDISHKSDSKREAVATSVVTLGKKAFELVKQNQIQKGDVISAAKIAGIMAAKSTSNLIPLCHPLPLSKVAITVDFDEEKYLLILTSYVQTLGKTGVEMEALVSVSVAALTVYDMCKSVTKDITINQVQLMHKSGGESGDYFRSA